MTPAWILGVMRSLPVWVWPVFLWEVARFQLWAAGLKPQARTLITLQVTWSGRIVLTGLYEGERPRETGWTSHAPRARWTAPGPDTIAENLAALAGRFGVFGHDTVVIPPRYRGETVMRPEIRASS